MVTDILLFLLGIFTGGMNAVAGGGGLVNFPTLLAVGLSAVGANATANVVTLPGQITSAWGYRKYLRTVPKQYVLLLLPCTAGAIIGAFILRNTSSKQFGNLVPGLIVIAVLLFALQPYLHLHIRRHLKSRVKRLKPLLFIGLALFPLSIYGGFFGAGLGFVVLALLGFTKLADIHQMNGMKNVAGVVIAAVDVVVLSHGPFINWHYGLVMAAGSAVGGYGGARVAQKFSTHVMRIIVIAIGIVTATYIAFRNY